MKKIKYLFHCIIRMDYKNIINCGLFYGAGYYDYQEFEFYLLNKNERKNYLTRTKNNMIINKYNDKKYFYLLDDKVKFNEKFSKYINRDFMFIDGNNFSDFDKFFKKHKAIITKIINGEGGKGVEKFTYDSKLNVKKLYNNLYSKKELLIEECIIQNKEVGKLYSDSVNTLRLFTFCDGNDAVVLNQVFKIGNGGVTDNFSSGGMYTFCDENGVVIVPAIDRDDNIFSVHPVTNEKIVGFKIPYFKEACSIVCSAAKEIKEIKYIGWDVAIGQNGPVIIEGNSFPGVFQIKPSFMKNMGLVPRYKKYMDID